MDTREGVEIDGQSYSYLLMATICSAQSSFHCLEDCAGFGFQQGQPMEAFCKAHYCYSASTEP